MRTALRIAGRIGLWIVAVFGGFWLAVFLVLVVAAHRSDTRLGAIVLAVPAAALLAAGMYGLRHTRRIRVAAGERPPPEALNEAYARLRAGEPVVLHPSRRKFALLLAFFGAGGAICVWAAIEGGGAGAVFGALFCAAMVWLAGGQLIPSRAYLRIAREGLVARGPLRTWRFAWNDVEHFTAYEIQNRYGSTKQVGFDRRDLTPERQSFWQTMSRGMTGVDGALPDTYGLPHTDLAELLNEARHAYATEHGISASERADRELMRQAARVPHDRIPAVTATLTAACVAVFAVEVARYGLFPDASDLLTLGAASRDALAEGRWWTLLSANVLHGNVIHIVLNLIAFGSLGWLLEREIGWARFALLCVVGGVAAMGCAVLLQIDAAVVGISGVIFAVGGWAVLRDTYRTRALGAVAWAVLPVGVIYTFLTPGVSIGAHLGGLAAGLVLGWAFERSARLGASAGAGMVSGRTG